MTFGEALNLCISGYHIQRSGWNGKGMWIVYQSGYPEGININKNTAVSTGIAEGTLCKFSPYLMMKAADDSFFPWNPNQLDLLSNDWQTISWKTT